jgi:apolipoprotein N-acyltransferase
VSSAAAVAATLLSMLLFGWSFPPVAARPLAWVALAPFLLAVRLGSARRAVALAFLWSIAAAWAVGDWMPEAVEVYFLQPRWVGFLLLLGVVATMAAPYYGAFAVVWNRVGRSFGPTVLPFLAGAAWVAAELGRGRLFTGTPFFIGNPWGLVGYTQVGFDAMIQIASVTGVYGLGFLIAAVNAALCELAAATIERRPRRPAWVGLALALGLTAASTGYGFLRLQESDAPRSGDATRVALIQGDVRVGARWSSEHYGTNLATYLQLTRRALQEGDPQMVFWPESALTFFLEEELGYRRAIARVLAETDAELLVGGPRSEPSDPPRFFNSIFLFSADGVIGGRYDKQLLVPFSEYFPFGAIDLLRRRFERVRTFTHGQPSPPFETRAGLAGVLVCNEAMLPEVAGRRVAQGAAYLVNPSNDTWIPSRRFAAQLFDIVSLRAVEQRRYLVRASTSGPSAIVDPWGRVLERSEPFSSAVVLGEIRPRQDRTLYSRVGDLFAVLCVVAVVVALLVGRSSRRGASPAPRGFASAGYFPNSRLEREK